MIKRAIVLLAALAISPATAAVRPPDNAVVSATLAALRAGDVAELEWLVSQTGALQFPGLKPADRTEAFKALLGCKPRERLRGQAGGYAYFEFEWKCRTQTFVGKLIPEESGKAVALFDFLTKAEYKERSRRIPYVMLPPTISITTVPPPLSAAAQADEDGLRAVEMSGKKELAGLFARAVADGDMAAFQSRHVIASTITYGFFDPYGKQDYIDRAWHTGETRAEAGKALSDAVAYGQRRFGKPVSWACEDAYPYVDCTWQHSDPATRLTAKIHIMRKESDDWMLHTFQFRYVTGAKLEAAKQRAART